MWYDNKRPSPVKAPSKGQKWILRTLIFIGLGGMAFFIHAITRQEVIAYAPLYYLLLASLLFICFKVAYEWYHYFSIDVPNTPPLERSFTVDVLTTYVPGEPYEMVIHTLEAIQAIEYPHETYLCDEGDDPYLKRECERLGVHHVTRIEKKDAKAGNINNALRTAATGEICLVLDPDHVPAPDFFEHVLPHFQDPKVGFVQVVQAYDNIYQNMVAKGSAQQTFQFYGPIMMSSHHYGTAQAIGANCTFRRAALDSIGGHAAGLAEDMNTSMHLHAEGWQSVYVPRVLTRGLVPDTISAYYKQQLKWSRGVMELLVTTYRQKFWQFSGRQRLYYGFAPGFYLSGFVYAINFLIPIISLIMGVLPMQLGLAKFLLMASPFILSTLVIRHYVQSWVMEEDERGFHVQGGLLFIGAWWIHILGVVFTFLRRKVPYNPTPKDGREEDLLRLNLPNMTLAIFSIGAIIYGLYQDFNPYSLIMAGFAALNVLILSFNLLAAYQNRFRRFKEEHPLLQKTGLVIAAAKKAFWIFRHRLYGQLRLVALPLMGLFLGFLFVYARSKDITQIEEPPPVELSKSHYLGVFDPSQNSGQLAWKQKSDIQAYELSWSAPEQRLSELLSNTGAAQYPLLYWQPEWGNQDRLIDSLGLWPAIYQGHLDGFLKRSADRFVAFAKPIFLHFAQEPDNPSAPWYRPDEQADEDFIKAWRYLHHFMRQEGASNLIWVYRPWRAESAQRFFPGQDYVDWLAVNGSNYGPSLGADQWYSFEEIYAPYHRSLLFKSGLPVMISHFGTLGSSVAAQQWFQSARASLKAHFPEVQALIFNAEARDKDLPKNSRLDHLNWGQHRNHWAAFQGFSKHVLAPQDYAQFFRSAQGKSDIAKADSLYPKLGGVNYRNGQDWQASLHPLFKSRVLDDFRQMKSLGIHWVKRYGPGVYDRNILDAAEATDLQVLFGLWIEKDLDFLRDSTELIAVRRQLLSTVRDYRGEKAIAGWHLGNPVWHTLGEQYAQPQLRYQRAAYLQWLKKLAEEIKTLDPERPLSFELKEDHYLTETVAHITQVAPDLDAIGLDLRKSSPDPVVQAQLKDLARPLFYNKLPVGQVARIDSLEQPWFIRSWQDDVFERSVTFDGLLDHRGRKKLPYQALERRAGRETKTLLPRVQVLPGAQIPFPGTKLHYAAMVEEEGRWRLAAFDPKDYHYLWTLVKVDRFGNAIARKEVGEGTAINLTMPPNPQRYRLSLNVSRKGVATSAECPLVTPVYWGSELEALSSDQIDYIFKESKK